MKMLDKFGGAVIAVVCYPEKSIICYYTHGYLCTPVLRQRILLSYAPFS